MIRIADIQRVVADHYQIPIETMREPRPKGKTNANRWPISHSRHVAICLAARLTEHSMVRIGQFFGGRDHSTVMHAIRKVEADPNLHGVLRRLTLELVRK